MGTPPRDLLDVVYRRAAVLERLDDRAQHKCELTDQLDVSRQTVNRAVRELESVAIAERTPDGYRLTLVGSLAYQEFSALLDRFEWLSLAGDLLAHLPTDTEFDLDMLAGAEIIHARHPTPHEPIRAFEQAITETDHVVGYSPVVFPQYVSLFHDQILNTATEVELHLDTSLIEQLWVNYDGELGEALSEPNVTIYHASEIDRPNLGVSLLDDSSVWIGIYDVQGNVQGMIITESDRAVEWARVSFERFRSRGNELSLRSTSDE